MNKSHDNLQAEIRKREESDAVQAIHRVVVSRLLEMIASNKHEYHWTDIPKLFAALSLLGDDRVKNLKRRWPATRRLLMELSKTDDPRERKAIREKHRGALGAPEAHEGK
jgi:hypothetical protein